MGMKNYDLRCHSVTVYNRITLLHQERLVEHTLLDFHLVIHINHQPEVLNASSLHLQLTLKTKKKANTLILLDFIVSMNCIYSKYT